MFSFGPLSGFSNVSCSDIIQIIYLDPLQRFPKILVKIRECVEYVKIKFIDFFRFHPSSHWNCRYEDRYNNNDFSHTFIITLKCCNFNFTYAYSTAQVCIILEVRYKT